MNEGCVLLFEGRPLRLVDGSATARQAYRSMVGLTLHQLAAVDADLGMVGGAIRHVAGNGRPLWRAVAGGTLDLEPYTTPSGRGVAARFSPRSRVDREVDALLFGIR